ncbi:hypothetical protein RF55_19797, partial [Lasius niger]
MAQKQTGQNKNIVVWYGDSIDKPSEAIHVDKRVKRSHNIVVHDQKKLGAEPIIIKYVFSVTAKKSVSSSVQSEMLQKSRIVDMAIHAATSSKQQAMNLPPANFLSSKKLKLNAQSNSTSSHRPIKKPKYDKHSISDNAIDEDAELELSITVVDQQRLDNAMFLDLTEDSMIVDGYRDVMKYGRYTDVT